MYDLVIEPTSYCNQSCYFCPQHKYRLRNRTMPMEMFKTIIDSIYDMGIPIKLINFSGMGEPLMDNLLFERAKYARKVCTTTEFYTNGALFTEEKMRLANETMNRVYFSIHTDTPAEYEKYSGNRFEKIKEIAKRANRILGGKLIILNYPHGSMGKHLGLPTGSTHPFHNWGDKEISKRTGSKMSGCEFCGILEAIKIRVNGAISTCANDWNVRNDILNRKFPVCRTCYNYEHFKNMISNRGFSDYVETLKRLQERIHEH